MNQQTKIIQYNNDSEEINLDLRQSEYYGKAANASSYSEKYEFFDEARPPFSKKRSGPINSKNGINHLEVAKNVIKNVGNENILFTLGSIWLWKGNGVWSQVDDREIKQVVHSLASNQNLTAAVVNSILDLVKTEASIHEVEFDQNPKSINCLNGELSYVSGKWVLEPHNREHYRTSIIPVEFNPDALAPRFSQFLQEIFSGDSDSINKVLLVEEAIGYTLIPSCYLEKFLMLIGGGANGKSVLLSVVLNLIGKKNVSAVQPAQFDQKFQRAHLFKKLANIVTEIKEGGEIADAELKSLTSGELTTAENKFVAPFDFIPYATHWFGTNHLPHTRDFSDALFRRGIILTFNNKFEGKSRDVRLGETLKMELSGIFNMALKGLARLLDNDVFTECPSSYTALNQWRLEADQAAQFVEECCEKHDSRHVPSGELYKRYIEWADSVGIRQKLAQKTLSNRLERLGFKPHRKGAGGTRVITGLVLKCPNGTSTYSMTKDGMME